MINYLIFIPHYNIPNLLGCCLRSIPEREDMHAFVQQVELKFAVQL